VGEAVYFSEVQEEKWLPMDEAAFARGRNALLDKLKDLKAEETVAAWLKQAKAEAKIINNIEKEKAE
jgi:hypothetical protein